VRVLVSERPGGIETVTLVVYTDSVFETLCLRKPKTVDSVRNDSYVCRKTLLS
jgi:hypothetical protein